MPTSASSSFDYELERRTYGTMDVDEGCRLTNLEAAAVARFLAMRWALRSSAVL